MGSIDPGQLGAWFEAHGRGLLLFARQMLDAQLAEDAVQDVFLRLASQRRRPDDVKAWLYRSVRNAAISALRKQARRRRREQARGGRQAGFFEARPDDLADAAAAQEALASLPAERRQIVVLRIWADMTLREVAEVVGRPLSTVFDEYHAAIAAIRKAMGAPCRKND